MEKQNYRKTRSQKHIKQIEIYRIQLFISILIPIHDRAPNIYCAGAGTAADCDKTTASISSQLELHRLNTGRQVRVVAAQRMVKQMLFRWDHTDLCNVVRPFPI